MNRINLMGIDILNITLERTILEINRLIEIEEKKKIFFVNADCFNKLYCNQEYRAALTGGPLILGDGTGVAMGAKMRGERMVDNVNGTDLLPPLIALAQQQGYPIFLLGGKPGVAKRMGENLTKKYPGLTIAGYRDGYFDRVEDSERVVAGINRSGAKILLVAFGAPLQELWITQYFNQINATIQIGVGGLFDFYSGDIPRAPRWMRKGGIEWIYRLRQEPRRLWRRYIIGNPLFIYRMGKWAVKRRFYYGD